MAMFRTLHILLTVSICVELLNYHFVHSSNVDEFEDYDNHENNDSPIDEIEIHVHEDGIRQQHDVKEEFLRDYGRIPRTPTQIISHYSYEVVALCVLLVYGFVYLKGCRENEEIARQWIDELNELFCHQFAAVGLTSASSRPTVIKDSPSNYKYFCSGRRYCYGALMELELIKRNDMFSVIWSLIYRTEDYMKIQIAMNKNDMDPFIFAFALRKEYKQLCMDYPYLNEVTAFHDDSLPESVGIYTDCSGLVNKFCSKLIKKTISENVHLVKHMIITDQNKSKPIGFQEMCPNLIHIQLRVPKKDDMKSLKKLVELSIYLVDVVANNAKLDKDELKRSEKRRKEFALKNYKSTREQREEAIEKKRALKLQKEKEQYEALSYEQQQRRDEHQERKRMRKRAGRMKMKAMAR